MKRTAPNVENRRTRNNLRGLERSYHIDGVRHDDDLKWSSGGRARVGFLEPRNQLV